MKARLGGLLTMGTCATTSGTDGALEEAGRQETPGDLEVVVLEEDLEAGLGYQHHLQHLTEDHDEADLWPPPPTIHMENLWPAHLLETRSCVLVGERRFRPEGLVLQTGGRVVVSDGINNKVKVFCSEGQFLGCIGSKGRGAILKPRSIAGIADGTLAVYDEGDKSIKVFSITEEFLYKIEDEFTESRVPLATADERTIVFPYRQSIVLQPIMQHAPEPARFLDVTTSVDLGKARSIAISLEHIVLCGMTDDDVIIINRQSGDVIKELRFSQETRRNRNIGLQSSFFGVCFDGEENIYVLDTDNNNIVFIQSEPTEQVVVFHCDAWIRSATQHRHWAQLSSVLLCPKFVCLTAGGELLVLEHLGSLKVLALPGGSSRGAVRRPPRTGGTCLPSAPPGGTTDDMVGNNDDYKCC